MENVIQYVLYNDFIEFEELNRLLYINKKIYETVDHFIMIRCNQYASGSMFKNRGIFKDKITMHEFLFCHVCDFELTHKINPFTNKPTCRHCMRRLTIHKSKAKKIYKLTDADLANLDYHCYHMTSYRLAYIYELKKVKFISILKKIKKNKEEAHQPKKITKKDVREKRIYELLDTYNIENKEDIYHIMAYDPIYYYIKSGLTGIRKCKKIIEYWKKFKEYLELNSYASMIINDINMNTYFDRFIENQEETICNIKACSEIMSFTKKREEALLNKLEEYNIDDEDEYKCEAYYDYITGNESNIDLTVLKIREYHFFVCYTNFLKIRIRHMSDLCLCQNETEIQETLENLDTICKNIALLEKKEFEIPKFIKLKYLY